MGALFHHGGEPSARRALGPWALSLGLVVGCGEGSPAEEGDPERQQSETGGDVSEPSDVALPPVQPLCDGSDDVRFAFASGLSGNVWPLLTFAGEHADLFIAIDGHCSFWVYDGSLRGLRGGVLEAEYASELSNELHIGRYAAVDGDSSLSCYDAGPMGLWDGTAALQMSSCGPSADAPRVWHDAYARIGSLFGELDALATPAWQRTHILPLHHPPETRIRPAMEWLAPLDLQPLALDYMETSNGVSSGVGVLVEDEPTLASLAMMRAATIDAQAAAWSSSPSEALDYLDPGGLYVRDTQTRYFSILVRDEPPEPVLRAVHAAIEGP